MEKNIINKPTNNVLFTIIVAILCASFAMSAPSTKNSGLGGIAILLMPIFLGFITILIYYISQVFTQKFNWIITVIGTAFNVITLIQLYQDWLLNKKYKCSHNL